MILRRVLLAAGRLAPVTVRAQGGGKGFYASGTKQRAVRFAGSDGAILAGTLLLPIKSELGRLPGVVLVAGSGPTDRDGNNTLVPERIDLLKQLAELLARAGIATLRYDKRGIGGPTPRPHGGLDQPGRSLPWHKFAGQLVAAAVQLGKLDERNPTPTA